MLCKKTLSKAVFFDYSDNLWINKPLLSLGSNQVDLGGMMAPASAMSIRSSMVVGCMENATAILPSSTRSDNAFKPRIPLFLLPRKAYIDDAHGNILPVTVWITGFLCTAMGRFPGAFGRIY